MSCEMLVTPGPGLLGKLFLGKLGTNGPAGREREREGISPLYYSLQTNCWREFTFNLSTFYFIKLTSNSELVECLNVSLITRYLLYMQYLSSSSLTLISSYTLLSDFEDKDHIDIMKQDYHHPPLGFIKISHVKSWYTGSEYDVLM